MVTLVGLVSFFVSSYALINSKKLYRILGPKLNFLEKESGKKDEMQQVEDSLESLTGHVVVVGGDQMGESIMEALQEIGMEVVVVDFDQEW